jgi:hypothetical protein
MPSAGATWKLYSRNDFARPFEFTDDDLALVDYVSQLRLIDSNSLVSLFPDRSSQHLKRRLKLLFENGFLYRPAQQQIRHETIAGSFPKIYALDRKGAKLINDRLGRQVRVDHWLQKNRGIKWWNIEHTLSTAQFQAQLMAAIGRQDELSLLTFDDILAQHAPEKTKRSRQPGRFRTPVTWHGRQSEEGIAPDRIFGVQAPDNDNFIFFENDQGTETIEPSVTRQRSPLFFQHSSILRKLVVYANAFQAMAHRDHFGILAFRVVTVTTTQQRAENMAQVCAAHVCSGAHSVRPGLFLFTDRETLSEHDNNPLAVPYLNGAGKMVVGL